jgi:5'-AMP-activated protein kinase regulatory beta subunit
MGNASATEMGNGHAAPSLEQVAPGGGGGGRSAEAAAPPDAVMRELPPPVPYVFAPQVTISYPGMAKKETLISCS